MKLDSSGESRRCLLRYFLCRRGEVFRIRLAEELVTRQKKGHRSMSEACE
jgi:hypothetical protein